MPKPPQNTHIHTHAERNTDIHVVHMKTTLPHMHTHKLQKKYQNKKQEGSKKRTQDNSLYIYNNPSTKRTSSKCCPFIYGELMLLMH